MSKLEILAPAGNFDALIAAVSCGANAVYLGSKSLNARRNAGNFDELELARAVEYCHVRGVKVYQTLNILMFEEETEEVVRAVKTAAGLGVDAILVQDLGVAAIARQCAPQLPLHASTQMAVHNLSGALLAQELGFRRVVLAREMTKKEIARVVEGTDLEVEVFVHGALCMSVSGQCYLSSMIGERSGNRGLCAQPCRLPFQARGGIEYALSLKDLTLADRIDELREIGVKSLKIEGRMKRPEYAAAAVTAVKTALEGGYVDFETLRSVFSRSGFTKGYFEGNIDKAMFGTRQKEDVVSAAGVLKDLARLYDREQPLVPVDFDFQLHGGEPARLTLFDRMGNQIEVEGEEPQIAQNRPTDREKAAQNLGKTGGTPYYMADLECGIDPGLMLPASALNAMRRQALEELTAARAKPRPWPFEDRAVRHHPKLLNIKIPTLRARLTGAQLTDYIAQYCDRLILPMGDLPDVLRRGIVKDTGKLVAEIPRILFSGEERVEEQLLRLRELGITRAWAGNLAGIRLAREAGMEVLGGYSLNIINSTALKAYQELGLADTELSFEINLQKAKQLGDYLSYGILAYGYLPLMALRNCPIKAAMGCEKCRGFETLTDRKGVRFMVDCRGSKLAELYNSVPVYLADRMEELTGLSFLTLYFTCEDRQRCEEVVRAYREGTPLEGPKESKTRGLYYRNVQ